MVFLVQSLRQLRLLLWKDLMLMKRAKVWLFFQLIIPSLIIWPTVVFVVRKRSESTTPSNSHTPFYVYGNSSDVNYDMSRRFCRKDEVQLAFAWSGNVIADEARTLKSMVASRYPSDPLKLNIVEFASLADMTKNLIADVKNLSFCETNKFVGGIFIDRLDYTAKELSYKILLHDAAGNTWNMHKVFDQPYTTSMTHPGQSYPTQPPYVTSGFLTFQQALELEFYKGLNGGRLDTQNVTYMGLPEPSYHINSLEAFMTFWTWLIFLAMFLIILHCTREIAAEKNYVKPYLSAMGLSTFLFYSAHCIFALIKALVVLLPVSIYFALNVQYVSIILFILTVISYAVGAVTLAALVASISPSSTASVKIILFVWVALIVHMWKFEPQLDNFGGCVLYSLNINAALGLATDCFREFISGEKTTELFSQQHTYSVFWALLMLLFDAFWMMLAAWSIDTFRDHGFSFAWILEKIRKRDYARPTELNMIDGMLDGTRVEDLDEIDGARDEAVAHIEIVELVKVWPSTGETAVDGFNLRAVKGQVAVLLGHNGAGKSTTFACIAGIENPTYGIVKLHGHNMQTERSSGRRYLGLCPQYNPLYENLTVMEHLQFVHGLKRASTDLHADAKDLLEKVRLLDKTNVLSSNLSGGMKRKLCVCMSLIGDSQVVLLDEPTAGMDPGARKDVQDLLETEKGKRTILLTTHYMNEAERLGDFVYIMSHGRKIASGSGQHLKTKFGTGYILTVVLDQARIQSYVAQRLEVDSNSDPEMRSRKREEAEQRKKAFKSIEDLCRVIIPAAKIGDQHGNQAEITLPEIEKKNFGQLFSVLEAVQDRNYNDPALNIIPIDIRKRLEEVPISTFGLALNTLEQVFIKIGEIGDNINRQLSRDSNERHRVDQQPNYNTQISSKSVDSFMKMTRLGAPLTGINRLTQQIKGILYKRVLYTWYHKTQLIGQVLFPLVLFCALATYFKYFYNGVDIAGISAQRSLTLDNLGKSTVLVLSPPSSEQTRRFEQKVSTKENLELMNQPQTENLITIMQNTVGHFPAIAVGLGYAFNGIQGLFNFQAYHSAPTILSAVNSIVYSSENVTVTPTVALFAYTESHAMDVSVWSIFLGPMLILIFAMVTSTFVIFLVEERISKFTHQQTLSGISPLTYWLASFFYEFLFYTVAMVLYVLLFAAFGWLQGYLPLMVLFLYLYFLASTPFIYIVSNIFSSSSKANVLLVIWQIAICLSALAFVNLGPAMGMSADFVSFVNVTLTFLLPSYAFGCAIITISVANDASFSELLQWNSLGRTVFLMLLFSVIFTALFIMLQFKTFQRDLSKAWNKMNCFRRGSITDTPLPPSDIPICTRVSEEEKLVQTGNLSEQVLVVDKLTKKFGNFTAVNELYLTVKQNECFGLLGVNGAGKTTTFDMLTGQSFATDGKATINDEPVYDQISIGYCPQFDALMPEFTSYQTLKILALMYGFEKWEQKIDCLLECVEMTEHAHKPISCLSGGQKRKISMGIALMAPTEIIILDEPTAGIDPIARRGLWDLVLWIREHVNSAIMLTSHSMEECEALCSRIGVLNRGKLIAIGTSQDLKSLYGNSYSLTMTLADKEHRATVSEAIKTAFPRSVLKTKDTSQTMTLQWQLPKNKSDKWSTLYEQVERLAEKLKVKDYCLTQSSLEDTFLRLSGINDDSAQESLNTTETAGSSSQT